MLDRDYHIHTCFSSDSKADPYEMAERAVECGLRAICFTDHTDIGYNAAGTFTFDPEAYFSKMREVRDAFSGRLEIHIGVELGLLPDDPVNGPKIRAFAEAWPWEFIIGSTHLLRDPSADPTRSGPLQGSAFTGSDVLPPDAPWLDPWDPAVWYRFGSTKAIFENYYETVLKNVQQYDCFDSLGHLDYIARYVPEDLDPYRYEDHREVIDEILRTVIAKGKRIEINTAGLRKVSGRTNPETRVIARYLALGGTSVTYGSDAHRPVHVGYGFDRLG